MNKLTTQVAVTVPFYDLDPMNIVWHGNYIKYLEKARCDFFRMINYTYDEILQDGIVYPIAKMDLKFAKSARFGQKLLVSCTLVEVEPALIFKYKIVDYETKDLICSANTIQMGVNQATGETIYTLTDKFKRKLDEYQN